MNVAKHKDLKVAGYDTAAVGLENAHTKWTVILGYI